MTYSSGYLHNIVTIRNKVVATQFGETTTYQDVCTVHARKVWKSGNKALRESTLDAIDVVIFRMRWNNYISRDSLLVCDGKTYQVLSLEGDKQENQIEIKAQEVVQAASSPQPIPSSSEI
jgi:head-tail adaptor